MTIRPITIGLSAYLLTVLLERWHLMEVILRHGYAAGALSAIIIVALCQKSRYRTVVISAAIGTIMGTATVWLSLTPLPITDISRYADGDRTVMGWIAEPPERQPTRTRYDIAVTTVVEPDGSTYPVTGRIRATDALSWPRRTMGDAITLRGKLEVPGMIEDFDEAAYLRVRGISAVMRRAHVETWETAPITPRSIALSPLRPLSEVREWCERQITRVLPEPHASLLAGLLTGSRVGLPQDLSDAMRKAGLTHIVAISGYNITIILSLASGMLFWLPRRKRLLPLIIGTVAFVLFVGAEAPVLRAGIMGIIGLIALEAERPLSTRLILLWTATIMTAWNPLALQYDASFQLSFLATIGLMEIGPLLVRLLHRIPCAFAIRESLAATLAAQIATLPLSIIIFRQVSLIAPLSNLLVAPLIPLAMLTGAIGTLLGVVALPIGLIISYSTWLLLEIILQISLWSASLPLAAVRW